MNKFKPTALILEHYNRCNLRCPFCARTYTPESEEKKMSLDLAEKVISDIGAWVDKIRVHLTPLGELFLNDLLFGYIKFAVEQIKHPYIVTCSNGIPIIMNPELGVKFFEVGGHQLIIDLYHVEIHEMLMVKLPKLEKQLDKLDVEVYLYRDDTGCCYTLDGEKVGRFYLYYHKGSKKYFIINVCYDVEAKGKGGIRKFHNMGGHLPPGIKGIDYKPKPYKFCLRPFREITVDYYGCVRLCCQSFWNDIVLGKFPEDGSLEEIWNNDLMWVYRWFLRHAPIKRVLPPCRDCTYHGSFRPHEKIEKPDFVDVSNLEEVIRYVESTQVKYNKYKHKYYFECPWKKTKIISLSEYLK